MTEKIIPQSIPGIRGTIYAGFGARLGSLILDFLILLPFSVLVIYIVGLSITAYYYTIVPSFLFQVWFKVYLVKQYGGTPGKLIMGIKVLKLNGEKVSWKEAILREIISVIISILSASLSFYTLTIADEQYYQTLSWTQKQTYLYTLKPVAFALIGWVSNIWIWSELIVLLLNKRKRAIHDFIAKTVIVKAIYIEKIQEFMRAENSEVNNIYK